MLNVNLEPSVQLQAKAFKLLILKKYVFVMPWELRQTILNISILNVRILRNEKSLHSGNRISFFFLINLFNLFILGCIASLLLCAGFSLR